jgi:hypothetical protein
VPSLGTGFVGRECPYLALAPMRLPDRNKMIEPWVTIALKRPSHGLAQRTNSLISAGPVSRMNPQRKSAHKGRFEVTGRMGA